MARRKGLTPLSERTLPLSPAGNAPTNGSGDNADSNADERQRRNSLSNQRTESLIKPQQTNNLVVGYTTEEKMAAVAAAIIANFDAPESNHSLEMARRSINANISTQTLHVWLEQYRDQAIEKLRIDRVERALMSTRDGTLASMARVLDSATKELETRDFREDRTKDLALLIGVLFDKIERASSISPNLRVSIEKFTRLCAMLGYDASETLEDYNAILAERARAQERERYAAAMPNVNADNADNVGSENAATTTPKM